MEHWICKLGIKLSQVWIGFCATNNILQSTWYLFIKDFDKIEEMRENKWDRDCG